jgi:amino acid adenylation domain-containing protein
MQTEKMFTRRQTELSAAKQALLQKRLKLAGSLTPQGQFEDPIVPRPAADFVPLSFAQQRLWFLQQLEPESPAYNEAIASRISGQLNLEAFTLAGRELIRRHETLRTRFSVADGQVFQTIDPFYHQIFTVPYEDLSGSTEEEVLQRARAEIQRPFDLVNERPWRTLLWQLGEQEFFSLTIMHHLITDGWSLATFYREIGQFYSEFSIGQTPTLPESRLHYGDYAAWQQHWLDTPQAANQLNYWREQLRAPLPALELPLDHPRPATPGTQGQRVTVSLDAELSQALRTLSQQNGTTLFMILLTGFFILLNRYTQQEDLLIGTPIAGRTRPELESMFGFFINTLVLRADLSARPTVRQLLQQVRDVTLRAYDNQDMPFEKLVEVLQPERDLNRNPFFQVMFVLQNTPVEKLALRDLVMTPQEIHNLTAKFDLELSLVEHADQSIQGYFEYSTEILDAQTVERIRKHFEQVLRAMVADPSQLVSELPLLSDEETQHILATWNETQVAFPNGRNFADYVAEQATRTPTNVALSDAREQVTYQELQARARQLAIHLQQQGVGPETVVGLYTERSVAWGIAVLAIFQAGGVYLPLDPQYPEARTRYILKESSCHLLLTTRDLAAQAEALSAENQGEVLYLEDPVQADETTWQVPQLRPENLAYVIYTSGSTGQPKGAMIEQRGMLNHLYAKIDALKLSEQDTVAQTASQCFDISLWQLLSGWLVGARTQIYTGEIMRDPQALLAQMEQQRVSILEIVPSLLRAFCTWLTSTPTRPALAHLRWLIPTGEALTTDLARLWLETYPEIPLLNAYGPSECSDDVTHAIVAQPPSTTYGAVTIPIGRALPNMRVYVLDEYMQPLPIGVQGEIYAGGVGVGRGYLANATRTALQFVPDPWSQTGGGRLYRTGDRGYTLPDGSIVFTGRVDEQVKIRGYRVEPGEIAAAIREQDGVSDCAVICLERSEAAQLVAYVVSQPGTQLEQEALRKALQAILPAYMLPTIVTVDALPYTANGKLDRAALPVPGEDENANAIAYVAPRNPIEEQLATIWAEVLALPRVGIHDNFFAIGGHSLLIMQVLSRASDAFQVSLPVRALFKTPTIAELASTIEKSQARNSELRQQTVVSVSRDAFRQKRSALVEAAENI